ILVSMITPLHDTHNNNTLHESAYHTLDGPRAAAGDAYNYIEDIFSDKYNEFTAQDYFSLNTFVGSNSYDEKSKNFHSRIKNYVEVFYL
ncbi:unnamed protein product, partial [marine sediment metagenome]